MLRSDTQHNLLAGLITLLGSALASDALATELESAETLTAGCAGMTTHSPDAAAPRIGAIDVVVEEVFDPSNPRENHAPYRVANALHYATREQTVRQQLLFKEGQVLTRRDLEETARLLRGRRYLYDASVQPVACHPESNTVDVQVRVRDVWSMSPGVSFGRKGGANSSSIEFEDENFLGRGKRISLGRGQNVDRSTIEFTYDDPNVLGSWWRSRVQYSDNSDGYGQQFLLERPFYSLDSRWELGLEGKRIDQRTSRYELGESMDAFAERTEQFGIYGGWSAGLQNGWARRWLAGVRFDSSQFALVEGTELLAALPQDRRLAYPWVGVELIEDAFDTTHNQDQLQRTEDVHFGRRLRAELGFAASSFGSDRSATLLNLRAGSGYRFNDGVDSLFFISEAFTRMEGGALRDGLLSGETRYYHRHNPKRLFFAGLTAAQGFNLDHQLLIGGDTGLRGYPLRYQDGTASVMATVEERFFTNWYPLRLARVGAAVFADAGRTYGKDIFGQAPAGWLSDVGFGLRLGNSRSSLGNVLHLDVAFPLNGASGATSPQFLIQTKTSF